jgi:hypothetical protein
VATLKNNDKHAARMNFFAGGISLPLEFFPLGGVVSNDIILDLIN